MLQQYSPGGNGRTEVVVGRLTQGRNFYMRSVRETVLLFD